MPAIKRWKGFSVFVRDMVFGNIDFVYNLGPYPKPPKGSFLEFKSSYSRDEILKACLLT